MNYRYFVYNKSQTKRAVITPGGVIVEYENGGMMDTNIFPAGIHPGRNSLTRAEQVEIARSATEGVYLSPNEVKEIYRMWEQNQ